MALWEIIVLGIVQGLTEFLPVSSSGHLVVANALLEAFGSQPLEDLVEVEIVLHLGTLAAVCIVYRREILRLLSTDRQVIGLLLLATLPAAVVGLQIDESLLQNTLLAGCLFPVTAVGLLWISHRQTGAIPYRDLRPSQALLIGVLQALAILPGISRSGATLVGGLGVGLDRESAATFAFLLAIPAIAGGGLLKGIEAYQEGGTGTPVHLLACGFVVSLLVGLVALKLLLRWVRQGRLAGFAWYLIPLGLAVTAWQLLA